MEYHKYSCIPIINERGKHTGTITEGDPVMGIKEQGRFEFKSAEEVPITSFERRTVIHLYVWTQIWKICWIRQ